MQTKVCFVFFSHMKRLLDTTKMSHCKPTTTTPASPKTTPATKLGEYLETLYTIFFPGLALSLFTRVQEASHPSRSVQQAGRQKFSSVYHRPSFFTVMVMIPDVNGWSATSLPSKLRFSQVSHVVGGNKLPNIATSYTLPLTLIIRLVRQQKMINFQNPTQGYLV